MVWRARGSPEFHRLPFWGHVGVRGCWRSLCSEGRQEALPYKPLQVLLPTPGNEKSVWWLNRQFMVLRAPRRRTERGYASHGLLS